MLCIYVFIYVFMCLTFPIVNFLTKFSFISFVPFLLYQILSYFRFVRIFVPFVPNPFGSFVFSFRLSSRPSEFWHTRTPQNTHKIKQKEKYLLTGPNPGVQGGPVWRSNNWAKPSIEWYCSIASYKSHFLRFLFASFTLFLSYLVLIFMLNLHYVRTSQRHDKQFVVCAQLFPWKINSLIKSKIEKKLIIQ